MPRPTEAARAEARRLYSEGLKWCPRCASLKPHGEFHVWARAWDGRATYCKGCKYLAGAALRSRYRSRWDGDDPYANDSPKWCAYCAQDLPRSAFSATPSSADGLHGRCKECVVAGSREVESRNRQRWSIEDPYVDPSAKRCGGCGQRRPRSDFSPRAVSVDGLLHMCKGCNAAKSSAHRARVLGQWVEHVDRDVLWKRDQGICYLCNLPADPNRWDLEHIHPISHGGEHSYANTAVSHPSCNYSKGGKPWPDVSFNPAL